MRVSLLIRDSSDPIRDNCLSHPACRRLAGYSRPCFPRQTQRSSNPVWPAPSPRRKRHGRVASPASRNLAKGLRPQADIHTPTSISLRDAFPNGENSPFAACCILNYWAKFPCSAASSLCPYIGGSRQPLDRQVRYYSVTPQLASGRFEYLCCRPGTRGYTGHRLP